MAKNECKKCIHKVVCESAKSCDGRVPGCEHFKEQKKGRWSSTDIIGKRAGYSVRYYYHAECEVNPCRLFECQNNYCPNCGADMRGEEE